MPGDPGMNARATVRAGYDAIVTTFADSPGPWIGGHEMFFASLGAKGYERILHEQAWRVIEGRVRVTDEPEGPVPFLWVLAEAPPRVPR